MDRLWWRPASLQGIPAWISVGPVDALTLTLVDVAVPNRALRPSHWQYPLIPWREVIEQGAQRQMYRTDTPRHSSGPSVTARKTTWFLRAPPPAVGARTSVSWPERMGSTAAVWVGRRPFHRRVFARWFCSPGCSLRTGPSQIELHVFSSQRSTLGVGKLRWRDLDLVVVGWVEIGNCSILSRTSTSLRRNNLFGAIPTRASSPPTTAVAKRSGMRRQQPRTRSSVSSTDDVQVAPIPSS